MSGMWFVSYDETGNTYYINGKKIAKIQSPLQKRNEELLAKIKHEKVPIWITAYLVLGTAIIFYGGIALILLKCWEKFR